MKVFALIPLLFAGPALADLEVQFIEGAPVDRFSFALTGGCTIDQATLTIDLTETAGQLIFDTTAQGAGVEVFQPFVLVEGASQVATLPTVLDGDKILSLELSRLEAPLAFTTDLDDTIGAREITVSGGEIEGARVDLRMNGTTYSAAFSEGAGARIALPDCMS